MRSRWLAALELGALPLVPLVLALFLGAGCGEEDGILPPNRAPLTYLAIQGSDLDTVDYRQIMHWWGTDTDGRVVGYCVKWDGEWTPPEGSIRCEFDPSWVFTTATTDTFAVPTGGTFAERTFSVRAVDDDGEMDPIGQSQRFKLKNWLPELDWSASISLPDSSLPSVSFAWSPRDLDGRSTVHRFRYWLDGQDSTSAAIVEDTLIALAPEDFASRLGPRTLSVQAFDDALAPSNVIHHQWTVQPASGRFLLIDNVRSDVPGSASEDRFYRALLDSVSPGDYFVYDVETRGAFRSEKEVFPLLDLFEGVVWYSGVTDIQNDPRVHRNLATAEKGLGRYLDAGGRLLLQAQNAVGDSAGLSMGFARRQFGIDKFYRKRGSHDLGLPNRTVFFTELGGALDSLETSSSSLTADFPLLVDGATAPFFLPAGTPVLDGAEPPPTARVALAAFHAGSGRAAVLPFLLSRGNRRQNAARYARLLAEDVLLAR